LSIRKSPVTGILFKTADIMKERDRFGQAQWIAVQAESLPQIQDFFGDPSSMIFF
jgi:hypothetical protein